METWVIFVVWLLINWLVNVGETFTDILKHYFLQTNAVKFAKCMLLRTTLMIEVIGMLLRKVYIFKFSKVSNFIQYIVFG